MFYGNLKTFYGNSTNISKNSMPIYIETSLIETNSLKQTSLDREEKSTAIKINDLSVYIRYEHAEKDSTHPSLAPCTTGSQTVLPIMRRSDVNRNQMELLTPSSNDHVYKRVTGKI